MKNFNLKIIATQTLHTFIVLAVIFACACQRTSGSEFLGKWVVVDNAQSTMEIARDGAQFIIIRHADEVYKEVATYKDGMLDTGDMKLAHVKNSGTIVISSAFGSAEYKRLK